MVQDDEYNRFRLLNVFVGEAKTLQTVDTHQTALNLSSEIQSGGLSILQIVNQMKNNGGQSFAFVTCGKGINLKRLNPVLKFN